MIEQTISIHQYFFALTVNLFKIRQNLFDIGGGKSE